MVGMTIIKINAITVAADSGERARQAVRRPGRRDRRPGRLRGVRAAPADRRTHHLAGHHPVAGRGVVQGLGELTRVQPRAPVGGRAGRREGSAARWRAQRTVVLRDRRRLCGFGRGSDDRRSDKRIGRRHHELTAAAQRAAQIWPNNCCLRAWNSASPIMPAWCSARSSASSSSGSRRTGGPSGGGFFACRMLAAMVSA